MYFQEMTMDPITAALNAYSETLKFIGLIWGLMSNEQRQTIVNQWAENQQMWNDLIKKVIKPGL